MDSNSFASSIACDGCGLEASAEHIAERVARLELATRFRPIHINVLFVISSPALRRSDDFYGPPESREFFDRFMEAVGVPASVSNTSRETSPSESDFARLAEFQHRGYYLAYLSECPLPVEGDAVSAAISRLGSMFIRRAKFNYRPRQIAILGSDLSSLRDFLENSGMSSILLQPLETPNPGDAAATARFRSALAGG